MDMRKPRESGQLKVPRATNYRILLLSASDPDPRSRTASQIPRPARSSRSAYAGDHPAREAGDSMQDEAFGERKPLVHCPRCESGLIYAVDAAGYEAEVILNRRCPECEHRDSVVTSALAAAVWYRRDTRLMRQLMELADSLSEASPLPLAEAEEAA
jgi:hypothetical protein